MARARKRRRSGSRKGRMPAGLKAYWAKKRGSHASNPPKRRKRRRSATRASVAVRRRRRSVSSNPPKRHRRSYRRNPGVGNVLPSSGFIVEAAYVTGGFFLTRMGSGFVAPFIGPMADQPLVRIGIKGAVAVGLGFLGKKFLGQRNGQCIMLGGLVEVLSDAVRTYVSPYVPALAGTDMGSYPALSSYPIGDGYSNPYSVGTDDFDEAL